MEPQEEFMADGSDSARGGSKRPRLFIKEMVLRNFKSYAGEQRVGPFHKVRVSHTSRVFLNSIQFLHFRAMFCIFLWL